MHKTTHGDAIMILRSRSAGKKEKLQALDVIISDEHKSDYMNIPQPIMWDIIKMLYGMYKDVHVIPIIEIETEKVRMEFLNKIFAGFIQTCKDFGLSDQDIKDGYENATKTINSIKFDDKEHADEVKNALKDEVGKLGKKK